MIKSIIETVFPKSDLWNGSSIFEPWIPVDAYSHYNYYYTEPNWAHAPSSFTFTNVPFQDKLIQSLGQPKIVYSSGSNHPLASQKDSSTFIKNSVRSGQPSKSGQLTSKGGTTFNLFEIDDFVFKITKKECGDSCLTDNVEINYRKSAPDQGRDDKRCRRFCN